MRRYLAVSALAGLVLVASPAFAQSREYCPERPGLNTPPCIIDRGHVSIETALVDWTKDDQPDTRTDTVLIGDTIVRLGVTDAVEARIGCTPYGRQRQRDKTSGSVDRVGGVGDVTLGVKASLAHPSGKGFSAALLPFVSLPVGRTPIEAGNWAGGLLLPVSYDLSDAVQFEATPEVDASANADVPGRHLAYSATAGLNVALGEAVSLTGEGQVTQDNDPSGATTQALAALSLAVKAGKNLQFDVFGAAGLNHDSPDVELQAGVSKRF